jgi:hypothetical protein
MLYLLTTNSTTYDGTQWNIAVFTSAVHCVWIMALSVINNTKHGRSLWNMWYSQWFRWQRKCSLIQCHVIREYFLALLMDGGWPGLYLRTGRRGPGPGRQISRGGILKKKIEIEVWYVGKKGCPRERNLMEIYTENTMFCLLSVFVLFLLTHNWIRTNKGGGAQNFIGPRGVKYLHTGLAGRNKKLIITFLHSGLMWKDTVTPHNMTSHYALFMTGN